LGEFLESLLIFRRELVRKLYRDLDELIPTAPVPLDTLSFDPELTPWLRPGGDLEHDLLAVDRAHADPRSQHGLRQIHRNGAVQIESDPAEERIGLHLKVDDYITRGTALPRLALSPKTDALARIGSGWHRNHEPLVG
jgi:hypothetical protein